MTAGSTRGVGEGRRGLGSLFRLEVEALVAVVSRGRRVGAVPCRAASPTGSYGGAGGKVLQRWCAVVVPACCSTSACWLLLGSSFDRRGGGGRLFAFPFLFHSSWLLLPFSPSAPPPLLLPFLALFLSVLLVAAARGKVP